MGPEGEDRPVTRAELENFGAELIQKAMEQLLVALPSIIHHLIGSAVVMKGMSKEFYEQHEDLVGHKMLVAKAIEIIQAENPGMKLEEVLRKAAPRVKAQLVAEKKAETLPTMSRSQMDQELGVL